VVDETLVTEGRRLPWEVLLWTGTGIKGVVHLIGRQCRRPDTMSTGWTIISTSRNVVETQDKPKGKVVMQGRGPDGVRDDDDQAEHK
jgi:hypothetical protein